VAEQGICCGAGYEVDAYNDVGHLGVIGPTRILGRYPWFEPSAGDDVTFTQQQWLRYARVEARQCLKEQL
jgi:hypothetical protein